MQPPPIPHLRSLRSKPSWVNRAGRVDRSACFEVSASELWRRIPAQRWSEARSSTGREARADFKVYAWLLQWLHNHRQPRELVGDWRTRKSNAMKDSIIDPAPPPYWRGDLNVNFAPNPNKGATRTKKLGLWGAGSIGFPDDEWSQVVRVERWDRKARGIKGSRDQGASIPPSHQHFLICPACNRKMVKLMMVLCSEQEIDDAEIAEGWVRMIDAHPVYRRLRMNNSELGTRYSELVSRYGLLFRGRRLVCRNCLGVRYGEVRRERRPQPEQFFRNPPAPGSAPNRRKRRRSRKRKVNARRLTPQERQSLEFLKSVSTSIRDNTATIQRVMELERSLRDAAISERS
jgi:hypothetical protein